MFGKVGRLGLSKKASSAAVATIPVVWTTLSGPISATGSAVTKTSGGDGWDNVAYGSTPLTGAGELQVVQASSLGAWGFTSSAAPGAANAFQQVYSFGKFDVADGTHYSVYNNTFPIIDIGFAAPSDVFRMVVGADNVVKAYRNGVLVYTYSTSALGLTLRPFCTCFNQAAVITSASIIY